MMDISILHLIYDLKAKKARERVENGKTSNKFRAMEKGLNRLFDVYGGYCNPNDLELRNIISKIEMGDPVNTDGLLIMQGYEKSHLFSLMSKKRSFKVRLFLREIKAIEDCVAGKKIRELDELARALDEIENNYIITAKEGSFNFADQYEIYSRIQDVQRVIVLTALLKKKEVPFYRLTPPNETAEALHALYLDIYQIIETQKRYNKDKDLKKYADELRKEVVVYKSKRIDNIIRLLDSARALIRRKDYEMDLSIVEQLNTSPASDEPVNNDEPPMKKEENVIEPTEEIMTKVESKNNQILKVCKAYVLGNIYEGLVTSWYEEGLYFYAIESTSPKSNGFLFTDIKTYEDLLILRREGMLNLGDVDLKPSKMRESFKVANLPLNFYYLESSNGSLKRCETDRRSLILVSSKTPSITEESVVQIADITYCSNGALYVYEYADAASFKEKNPQTTYQMMIDDERGTLVCKEKFSVRQQKYDITIEVNKINNMSDVYAYKKSIIIGDNELVDVQQDMTLRIEEALFDKDKAYYQIMAAGSSFI